MAVDSYGVEIAVREEVKYTAKGHGYYRVLVEGEEVSKHSAEREALESAANRYEEGLDVRVIHDYEVQVVKNYRGKIVKVRVKTHKLKLNTPMAIVSYTAPGLGQTNPDTVPDAITFASQTNVAIATTVTSEYNTLSGTTLPAPISISGANNPEYQIETDPWTNVAGTISPGVRYRVRHESSAFPGLDIETFLTIGGVVGSFVSTTTTAASAAYPANLNQVYVDQTVETSSTYDPVTRTVGSGSDQSYNTIQEAITNAVVGTDILMRHGTYSEIDIKHTAGQNGTAWTTGNYFKLASYPGEWAKIDGTGLNSGQAYSNMHGISSSSGEYNKRSLAAENRFWMYERFEVTGCRHGIFLTGGDHWFRYLWIHDNSRTDVASSDELFSGIWVNLAMDNIVEFCNVHDNYNAASADNANNMQIGFDADYLDDEAPGTYNPNVLIARNEVRYNKVLGGGRGIAIKNQQRFGTNTRTASSILTLYSEWGNKVHHNFVSECNQEGIGADQDNIQVYQNIIDASTDINNIDTGVQCVHEVLLSSAGGALFNPFVYNNTVLNAAKSFGYGSGFNDDATQANLFGWFYNNLSVGNEDVAGQSMPFTLAADQGIGITANIDEVYIQKNLIHSNANPSDVMRGRNNAGQNEWPIATAEGLFTNIANNETSSAAGLFKAGTGNDQYKTNGTFTFGAGTLADQGIGTAHPYIAGVTLPSFIGATNPNDDAWVDGVLDDITNVTFLTTQDGTQNPTWLEA